MTDPNAPDGRHVHLLSAYDTATGIVLAQVAIAVKSVVDDDGPAYQLPDMA